MRRIPILAVLVLPLVVAACGFLPAADEAGPPGRVEVAPEDMTLAISNGTTLAVDLVVNGGAERKGAGARVDLSCGRLDIWSGPPMLGPMPGPGAPGDCNP